MCKCSTIRFSPVQTQLFSLVLCSRTFNRTHGIYQQPSSQSHFRWLLLIANCFGNFKLFPQIQPQPLHWCLNCCDWAAPGNQKLSWGIWSFLDPSGDHTLPAPHRLETVFYFLSWKQVSSGDPEILQSHSAKYTSVPPTRFSVLSLQCEKTKNRSPSRIPTMTSVVSPRGFSSSECGSRSMWLTAKRTLDKRPNNGTLWTAWQDEWRPHRP